MIERLEDADDAEKMVDYLRSDTKQRRGGFKVSKHKKELINQFLSLSKDIANNIWHVYPNISHNNLANMIKDVLDDTYAELSESRLIPSQRILSDKLRLIAPESAPIRQRADAIPNDTRNFIVRLIEKSLPDTFP